MFFSGRVGFSLNVVGKIVCVFSIALNTVNRHLRTIFFSCNLTQIAEILLEHGSHVNTGDKYGSTPLHRAACKGLVKMVKLLLSYNADGNQQDGRGCSAL